MAWSSRPSPASVSWSRWPRASLLVIKGGTVHVAGRVAVVVGTTLSAANQGSVIASGDASAVTWLRVAVNYLAPFVVASLGYLSACRVGGQPVADDGPAGHVL